MVPEVDGYAILLTLSNFCLARKIPLRFLIVTGTDGIRYARTSILSSI